MTTPAVTTEQLREIADLCEGVQSKWIAFLNHELDEEVFREAADKYEDTITAGLVAKIARELITRREHDQPSGEK